MAGTGPDREPRPGDDDYPEWAQQQARAGFAGERGPEVLVPDMKPGGPVTCPNCGHNFAPGAPQRVTETEVATEVAAVAPPYGDVEYADPGLQKDGKKRYPIDTKPHVRSAWSYISKPENAAKYTKGNLNKVRGAIKRAAKKLGVTIADPATEAMIAGSWSYDDVKDMVRDALRERMRQASGVGYVWCWVADLTDTDVVYTDDGDCDDLWQCSYTLDAAGVVTLGDPTRVVRTYAPAPTDMPPDDDTGMPDAMLEAERVTLGGRVLEAKGTAADGGRIFRVQVIAYGDSRNRRRYSEAVLRDAVPLYEGALAYDRHRDVATVSTGSLVGLVGHYRHVEATASGLEADLHMLPSAVAASEALDAALSAAEAGVAVPLGISHDVMATFRTITEGGAQLQECTAITRVLSADVVANPAAGGKAVRVVAGGIDTEDDPAEGGVDNPKEQDMPPTKADVLAALAEATGDELAAVGLSKAATETAPPAQESTPTPEPVTETAGEPKGSFLGRLLISAKIEDAGLPKTAAEAVAAALPDRITEADVDAQIAAIKTALGIAERSGLVPTAAPTAQVAQEAIEKKIKALDATFAQDWTNGYVSFRQAFSDITGKAPRSWTDGDFNRVIMRESIGRSVETYDSGVRAGESLTVASWDVILGDSITRRMVTEYARPSLATWRQIVSSVVPVNDFRTQRVDRLGGYGTLPAVNQGAPYQPLTSPADEEATYAITKRGGTEDLTLEMIADDDIRAIANIPRKLGLAAAQTLYRFIWDMLTTNATCTFDSLALYHASHSNTAAAALSQTALSARRAAMRGQTAYGDTSDVLSIIPKFLIVPSALEELAYQLVTSRVAVPSTPAGPSDTPNIHEGMTYLVVDYWSDTNDWHVVCDPSLCPTIEVGFYQGREEPELFTQADPTVGSMFNADKLTYKIRHIYSGTIIDYRGFQRGTQ